jgi:hypothetical protein
MLLGIRRTTQARALGFLFYLLRFRFHLSALISLDSTVFPLEPVLPLSHDKILPDRRPAHSFASNDHRFIMGAPRAKNLLD